MLKSVFSFVPGLLMMMGCVTPGTTEFEMDPASFQPRSYVCQRTNQGITIDGKLDDADWQGVPWTDFFVDIEGDKKPKPEWNTRVKMLWDDDFIYFGAELEEPHIWANILQRDAVIYHDNDFEIFIDPTGDTHNYLEYEVNAFGTIWDLMITKPYRDNGLVFNRWDISGIRQAIGINGTINNPADRDLSWTVEVAIPLAVVKEACHNRHPKEGDVWRLNFSRVQWHTDIVDGRYVKRTNAEGKKLPEENWVWSPQGVIAMHQPETWGFLQFSETVAGQPAAKFVMPHDEWVKWALRQIYYRQADFFHKNKRPASLKELSMEQIIYGNHVFIPELVAMGNQYQARIRSLDGAGWWNIRRDGYVWKE